MSLLLLVVVIALLEHGLCVLAQLLCVVVVVLLGCWHLRLCSWLCLLRLCQQLPPRRLLLPLS